MPYETELLEEVRARGCKVVEPWRGLSAIGPRRSLNRFAARSFQALTKYDEVMHLTELWHDRNRRGAAQWPCLSNEFSGPVRFASGVSPSRRPPQRRCAARNAGRRRKKAAARIVHAPMLGRGDCRTGRAGQRAERRSRRVGGPLLARSRPFSWRWRRKRRAGRRRRSFRRPRHTARVVQSPRGHRHHLHGARRSRGGGGVWRTALRSAGGLRDGGDPVPTYAIFYALGEFAAGLIAALGFFAFREVIHLLLTIEENTRTGGRSVDKASTADEPPVLLDLISGRSGSGREAVLGRKAAGRSRRSSPRSGSRT